MFLHPYSPLEHTSTSRLQISFLVMAAEAFCARVTEKQHLTVLKDPGTHVPLVTAVHTHVSQQFATLGTIFKSTRGTFVTV
jgi:hypothetical protein